MKHTKGPWTISENTEDKSKGPYSIQSDTCTIAGDVSGIGYDQAESNALLIAAAPELLEALQACLAALDRQNAATYGGPNYDPISSSWKEQIDARAAIAKATGKA